MGVLLDSQGRNQPFFVDYYEWYSIATEDFSPIEDPSLSVAEIGAYTEKGFLVKPNASGTLYAITLYDYNRNGKSLTGLRPEPYPGVENEWIECRLVKVYRVNTGTYRSVATQITIGITI